jgi:hypothetical protein
MRIHQSSGFESSPKHTRFSSTEAVDVHATLNDSHLVNAGADAHVAETHADDANTLAAFRESVSRFLDRHASPETLESWRAMVARSRWATRWVPPAR